MNLNGCVSKPIGVGLDETVFGANFHIRRREELQSGDQRLSFRHTVIGQGSGSVLVTNGGAGAGIGVYQRPTMLLKVV